MPVWHQCGQLVSLRFQNRLKYSLNIQIGSFVYIWWNWLFLACQWGWVLPEGLMASTLDNHFLAFSLFFFFPTILIIDRPTFFYVSWVLLLHQPFNLPVAAGFRPPLVILAVGVVAPPRDVCAGCELSEGLQWRTCSYGERKFSSSEYTPHFYSCFQSSISHTHLLSTLWTGWGLWKHPVLPQLFQTWKNTSLKDKGEKFLSWIFHSSDPDSSTEKRVINFSSRSTVLEDI